MGPVSELRDSVSQTRGLTSTEEWDRIRQLFESASELTGSRQQDFLANIDDVSVLPAVEALLQSQPGASRWLQEGIESKVRNFGSISWIGRRLGPYRLVRSLGEGGMGRVFLARREDCGGPHQEVALKMMSHLSEGYDFERRFLVEKEILARLDHPNICRLLDSGTSPEGYPYLVMEYVEGLPISRWCDEHQASIDERLGLMLQVCETVEYVHRHQMVHRDLKPANILVTANGSIKLIDFGITKVLGKGLGALGHDLTQAHQRLLTPGYASPEQRLGAEIQPTSDVWSLGILLYELVVGRRPYSDCDFRLMLAGEETRYPNQFLEQEGWQKYRVHDFEAILDCALQFLPENRYPSAGSFGEDLRRFTSGIPVLARSQCCLGRWVSHLRGTGREVGSLSVLTLFGMLAFEVTQGLWNKLC